MANSFFYSNTAIETALSGSISSGATSMTVDATTGFPASFPYVLAVDFGASTEELVKVTAAAATTLTVVRGFSGTSAQSHSLGAKVRHVFNAQDAIDFRTHEAATGAVHGLTGNIVGTTDTQTLTNKTLTAPAITNPTMTVGGSLSGTYTGTPTFSGALTLSGTPSISSGAALAGTFTGAPLFTGNPVFQGATASTVASSHRVTGDTTPRLQARADGQLQWGPGNAAADTVLYREAANVVATDDILRSIRASTSDNAFSARITTDTTTSHWFMNADGAMWWGPGGSTVADTNLYRSAANTLKTDDSLVVSGSLTTTGDLTITGVGRTLFARKTADTARTTATLSDDPDLTFSVAASAVYVVTGMLHFYTTDASTADIVVDWTVPTSAAGTWIGMGQPNGATGTDGTVRTMSSSIAEARGYGANTDTANPLAIDVRSLLVTADAGTYALQWARSGGSGTVTLLTNSYLHLQRVA